MKINWPRRGDEGAAEPATLVLRVEGPAALEIQRLRAVILERVNRFFGWQAIGRIALVRHPCAGAQTRRRPPPLDPEIAARIAESLPGLGMRIYVWRSGAWARRSSESNASAKGLSRRPAIATIKVSS